MTKPPLSARRAHCAGAVKPDHSARPTTITAAPASASDVPEGLIQDLDDALLAHDIDLTPELLRDILWAVGINRITPQQFAVLRAALGGANDKEIAAQLDIAEVTLELHWKQIRQRLGIASRFQLGAYFVAATYVNP